MVYGETASYSKPTFEQCKKYAQKFGVDPANMLIDNEANQGWPVLFDAIDSLSGGSLGLPWYCVLDGQSMEYIWASSVGTENVYSVIDELLAK